MIEKSGLKQEDDLCDDDQVNIGDYIFEIMDLVSVIEEDVSTEWLYTNLRGIFLRHDEQLGLSHEDFILFYVLSVLHPELPVYIRDKYKDKLGTKRILDFRADILGDSDKFLQSRGKDRLIIYTDGGDQADKDGGIVFDPALNTKGQSPSEETKLSRAKKNLNKYPCDHCDSSYQAEAKLVKHMFSKHPDMQVDVLNSKGTSSEGIQDKCEEINPNDGLTAGECLLEEKEEDSKDFIVEDIEIYHQDDEDVDDPLHQDQDFMDTCEDGEYDPLYCVKKEEISEPTFAETDQAEGDQLRKKQSKRHPCDKCEFTAARPSRLKAHKVKVHCDKNEDMESVKKADKKSINTGMNTGHVEMVSRKGYKCDKCAYETLGSMKFRQHMKNRHGDVVNDLAQHHIVIERETEYQCDKCDLKTDRPSRLKLHKVNVHGERIEDLESEKKVVNEPDRRTGIVEMVKRKGYQCDKCPYKTIRTVQFRRHKKNSHGEEVKNLSDHHVVMERFKERLTQIKCDICNALFVKKKRLEEHKRHVHSEVEGQRFRCRHCTFYCTSEAEVMMHVSKDHPGMQ